MKENQNKGITGPKGKKGPPGWCPACGSFRISWDASTDVSYCSCGWSNEEGRDKQIEEIKDHIDSIYGCDCAYYGVDGIAIATELYNAGYRKQSEGEWRSADNNGIKINGYMACSVCNVMIPDCGDNRYCLWRLDYCPHCGAKMKGGE